MSERPILFSGEMVRAILDGRKTQTRRVVKTGRFPQGDWSLNWNGRTLTRTIRHGIVFNTECGRPARSMQDAVVRCPFGQPGDRLWVRETWNVQRVGVQKAAIGYRAGGDLIRALGDYPAPVPDERPRYDAERRWRPSIHMPRWASRIALEVTGVRVERIQDISADDVVAEGRGLPPSELFPHTNRESKLRTRFAGFWNSLNEKRGYGWEKNPWVWVIEFRRSPTGDTEK